MTILVINAGSSSLKFQLFAIEASGTPVRRIKGQVEGIGTRPHFIARDMQGNVLVEEWPAAGEATGIGAALLQVVAFLRGEIGGRLPDAIGHRVVHGGPDFSAPVRITESVVERLERFVPLAPLHQPHSLAAIRAILERQPELPQVACFDTAFHRGHPEVADRFAIPDSLYEEGVRRYGFHGLSYEYIADRLGEVAPNVANGRVVVAHLGSGASMCALYAGRSVESTMGFTALDGLPMGTRPGQIDPGVLLYLIGEKGMSPKAVERLLYNDCGLKGLSGLSSDVRDLLASATPRAKLALDCFVHRIVLSAGMLAAALGGLDGFVFTAGIGENSPEIRTAVMRRMGWLGVEADSSANAANGPRISSAGSRVACYVIPTDEELMIARHTLGVMRPATIEAAGRRSA